MLSGKVPEKIAGLSGILAVLILFGSITTAIYFAPSFNLRTGALSDLGVMNDYITANLFNYGLMISGLLLIPFALEIDKVWEHAKIADLFFLLSGIGVFLVGFFPLGTRLHFPSAAFTFFSLALAFISIGGVMWYERGKVVLAEGEILTGIFIVLVWAIDWEGMAIPEIISGLVGSFWVLNISRKLLKESDLSLV